MITALSALEAEAIYIIRESFAQADNPALLFSMGKDSSVLLHLARKAFAPAPLPMPLLHIDTTWKFTDMYKFRDRIAAESDIELLVHVNQDGLKQKISPFGPDSEMHTEIMKTESLKQALDINSFDVVFGGARRDEEKSRAKERVFSFRNSEHYWDSKNQRPEPWKIYNGMKAKEESIRVFPLSNWTELDIWLYIAQEDISIVPLYFARHRPVVKRDEFIMMIDDDRADVLPEENIEMMQVRFRTLGCYPLTGAVESSATNLSEVINEIMGSDVSERKDRRIDKGSSSMEQKKQMGYF